MTTQYSSIEAANKLDTLPPSSETLPRILTGWDHTEQEHLEALNAGRIIKAQIDDHEGCNLGCDGCFPEEAAKKATETLFTVEHKGKKKVGGDMDDLEYRKSYMRAMFEQLKKQGCQTIDIVGRGEPTLSRLIWDYMEWAKELGMNLTIFTNAGTKFFTEANLVKVRDDFPNVNFFVKVWSRDPKREYGYVKGSDPNYSEKRDDTVALLKRLGFMNGEAVNISGYKYKKTRVAADVLMRKSNVDELCAIYDYCIQNGMMPNIKNMIPVGIANGKASDDTDLAADVAGLKADSLDVNAFNTLVRKPLEEYVKERYKMRFPEDNFYPGGGSFCTQSAGSVYIDSLGNVLPCVGDEASEKSPKFDPENPMPLKYFIGMLRFDPLVGTGCGFRLRAAKAAGLDVLADEEKVLEGAEKQSPSESEQDHLMSVVYGLLRDTQNESEIRTVFLMADRKILDYLNSHGDLFPLTEATKVSLTKYLGDLEAKDAVLHE